MLKTLKRPLEKYNNWVLSFTKKKEAEKALAMFSFAESSFFPIPIDPLLAAMISTHPKKTWKFVNIAAFYSILGALLGFAVGALLMSTVGDWLVDTYDVRNGFNTLGDSYNQNAFITVLAAAFTPIPYKIVTISAGAFSINLFSFIAASIIGRWARYGLVGWFSRVVGVRYQDKIHYFINMLSLAVIGLLVIVVFAATTV